MSKLKLRSVISDPIISLILEKSKEGQVISLD